MAYIADQDDDQIKKQQDQGLNTSGVVGANASAGPTASGGAAVDTKAPTSTGFVNLQQYVDANQGTGAKMATDATKDLSNQVTSYGQNATDTVNGAKSGFASASRDDEAKKITGGLAKDANGTYGQASKYLSSGYSGPQASDYTGTLGASKDTLNGQLNGVDKQSNQQDLLRNAYGSNGQYSNGFGQLDSFLIGGQQEGRDVINGVKAKTGDVNTAYNGAATSLNGMQTAAQNKLASNQAGIKTAAKTDLGNIVSAGNQTLAQKNASLNPNNVGTANASLGDVLTDKNHVDLQALSQLSGGQYDPNWNAKTFNAGTAKQEAAGPAAAPMLAQNKEAANDSYTLQNGRRRQHL
jgi:hypothetical protein